jgi:hypothetical protein
MVLQQPEQSSQINPEHKVQYLMATWQNDQNNFFLFYFCSGILIHKSELVPTHTINNSYQFCRVLIC